MTSPIVGFPELAKETLVQLKDACHRFPVRVSRSYLERIIRRGVGGATLETILIAGKRYTSEEAIQRFIEQTQIQKESSVLKAPAPKVKNMALLDEKLRKFNLPIPAHTE